jgi:Ca2+-binding EF-hand superfamily protein
MSHRNPKTVAKSGIHYLALLIKDNAVPIDECFCQFASIEAVTDGLESVKISEDAFLEVSTYLLGEFLDGSERLRLFHSMDIDRDGFLGVSDWRESLASAEYWMSDEGKIAAAAIRIQSIWRGHFDRSALIIPASGMFSLESVYQPMDNQKYWEDEEEVVFYDRIPSTEIDNSMSALDVLSALTALAHSKGLTPQSLFVFICKSSAFEPEMTFVLQDFVEAFSNLCGEELTDQLHELLSQAFQLLDLHGEHKVSCTNFFWTMRQHFETQHLSAWNEVESTSNPTKFLEPPFALSSDLKNKTGIGSLSNNEPLIPCSTTNETGNAVAPLSGNSSTTNIEALTNIKLKDFSVSATESITDFSSTKGMQENVSLQHSHQAAAIKQFEEAAKKAAELKKSSEAAAAKELAEAFAIKLAAEKLFSEATELKKSSEIAAAKQLAEAAAIKQAAEAAAAKHAADASAAFKVVESTALISAISAPGQIFQVPTSSSDQEKERARAYYDSSSQSGKLLESAAGLGSQLKQTSSSTSSAGSSSTLLTQSSFDPRSLVHHGISKTDVNTMSFDSLSILPQSLRPASSGEVHTHKVVRFTSNRPSTSDGSNSLDSSRSQSFDSSSPALSYASQSYQSRLPNSQQSTNVNQVSPFPVSRRAQNRPSTSFISSSDPSTASTSRNQNLQTKSAGPEFTKRVLLVDKENSCTWIRTCAQKIASRYRHCTILCRSAELIC